MPDTLASTLPLPKAGAEARKQKVEQTPETDIQQRSRRRARQSREYELIWLLQQRLRAPCSPVQYLGLTGANAACSHRSATARELSGLAHSHAATPQRVTRASCAQLLRSVIGTVCRWFA